ncbi:hypothetical protein CDD82_740 [Ophiocordyceps australis]|uniref:Trafficking protein particle complex subunit 11 domain-containing protein n=1 Tax=Ophiocordyceps australis TaxID=1399860 RepID=A0A2C5ZNQ2_9HYPO|nr:hypothetical protein CDD82_740 [Ophiocordyceps australis]
MSSTKVCRLAQCRRAVIQDSPSAMDGYPQDSLEHNVPFIVASGLNSTEWHQQVENQGILIKSDLPPLDGDKAIALQEYLGQVDDRGKSWTCVSREEPFRFRVKTGGRSFLLPPRRAQLPDGTEPLDTTPILHSPFSPLSPSSALYPDGLIDSQWIRKHQHQVPSIYACFYLLADDERLKADISNIKSSLARSGYKTRFAVILLGDLDGDSTRLSERVQDRLESIRRGTALDPKSIFYIAGEGSDAKLNEAMDNVLAALYKMAIEYYRDLGRHARKKRSRGLAPKPTVPPTSGTSRTLSLPDWNFRYDFKTAVLAEFRQELDAAIRSFEQAYEVLLGQDVLDVMPSWSPRWNEARLLSDIISMRSLRIHFWMGHTSMAARRWQTHRERIGDFVERRGRGTNNYGWQAWEARWATAMANLMERVGIAGLEPETTTLFLQPEKALLGERLKPWELLHHTGYWYKLAAQHLVARRTLAHAISDDDRRPPDSSPASQVASKAYTFDTYLCPDPHEEYPLVGGGVNHGKLIIDSLGAAREQFLARNQLLSVAEVSLDCAREMVALELWDNALDMLQPIWVDGFFRHEGWHEASEELCWLMRQAAAGTDRGELVVAIDWELLDTRFAPRANWHYDVSKSLDGLRLDTKPVVSLTDKSSRLFLSAGFAFGQKQSKAGEECTAQLVLVSRALLQSTPVTLCRVRVEFQGVIKPIVIEHVAAADAGASEGGDGQELAVVALKEEVAAGSGDDLPVVLQGQCDLTMRPGRRRILEMNVALREDGDAQASRAILSYKSKAYDVDYVIHFDETAPATGWYVAGATRACQLRSKTLSLQVEPRRPKMQMRVDKLEQYYTDERIDVEVELANDEDESATVQVDVHLSGEQRAMVRVVVAEGNEHCADEEEEAERRICGIRLGSIGKGCSSSFVLSIDGVAAPTKHTVQVRATYHVDSDAATTIVQKLSMQLDVVAPFEANYDMAPRIHAEAWPSLFDAASIEGAQAGAAMGITQLWCLTCNYVSFASEHLRVVDTQVEVVRCSGGQGARCDIGKLDEVADEGLVVGPRGMVSTRFDVVARKMSLGDRQAVVLQLQFVVQWRREEKGDVNASRLAVGEYMVLGSEPRVLASLGHGGEALRDGRTAADGVMELRVAIENPSTHLLTFGLTMEPGQGFAFSGAKHTTVHLLPLSRRFVYWRLVPLVRGAAVRPRLVVRDKYFEKVLRIQATEGLTTDKEGLVVWVRDDF